MVKKQNKDAIIIKGLLQKGWSQKKVAAFLKLSKQRVNYWALHEIKNSQNWKMKLKDIGTEAFGISFKNPTKKNRNASFSNKKIKDKYVLNNDETSLSD